MSTTLQITIASMLPMALTIIFILLRKYTKFNQSFNEIERQIIYGFGFGLVAIIGTEWGIPMNGAMVNARDAAVMTAGLLFGGPAGIIAGLIGGIERWIAVYWGVGTYTRVACTISTILAGFYSAGLRKYLFNNKKPSWGLAFAVGLVMEVFHMTMIYITNMDNVAFATQIVKGASAIMISANSMGLMFSTIVDSLFENKKSIYEEKPTIATTVQRWLLITVLVIFMITSLFMYRLQTGISNKQAQDSLTLAIEDAEKDIENASNKNLLTLCYGVINVMNKKDIKEIASDLDIVEINIVDKNGIIVNSTNENFINFDMNSGEQSKEFLCLLNGTEEYTQDYGRIAADKNIYRKYAGVAIKDGFVQVGYDASHLQLDVASEVTNVSLSRHVGKTGFIIIADSNGWVVSQPEDIHLNRIDDYNFNKKDIDTFYTATIDEKECYCYAREIEGYYVVSAIPLEEVNEIRDTALYANTFMEILVFGLLFGMVYQLIKFFIVDKINDVNKSLTKITDGDLNEVVDVRNNLEFDLLSNDINATVDTLKKYIAEANARIDAELEYAKNIQISALPHIFPKDPKFEMYALMDAAKEVGGDFYDFSRLSADKFDFLVADVSGKGIPGAMFMMRAKTVLSTFTEMQLEVNDVFTNGNERLCEGNDAGMFVTAWQASINLNNGDIKYANAGHNPPIVRRKDGTVEYIKGKAGFVLAGMEGVKYKVQEMHLNPGDIIFLYTDGVVEATNLNKELYGEDRLLEAMKKVNTNSMKNICNEILDDVNKFVGEAEQFDDITMLAFKYLG